jgi:aspartate aminotransferase
MTDLQSNVGFMGRLAPSATLAITAKAKAMKAAGEDVLSLSAGEPDFDTPEHIKEAAVKALRDGETKYTPAAGTPALRAAVAEKFSKENGIEVESSQVIVAPGAKYSVFSAVAALCGEGDEVVLPEPYWVSYPEIVKAAGAKAVPVATSAADNYELSPEAFESAITDRTKLLILNTPGNPTGAVYRKETLEKIAEVAVRENVMILADEIYEKLTYDEESPHVSIASFSAEIADRTITVNGFSKAYSMTGWRLGYLAAPRWLASRISALQSHTTSNPTTFAQAGALAALKGPAEPVEEMRQAFSERRDLIHGLISDIPGMNCIRPSGAFYIFCDISSFGLPSQDFCARLLEENQVAAVPGSPFGAEGNIRLSYACSDEVIKEAVARIAAFTASL